VACREIEEETRTADPLLRVTMVVPPRAISNQRRDLDRYQR